MKTINFKIQGNHESHHGSAVIVSDYNEGINYSQNHLDCISDEIQSNKIGIYEGYFIYENYLDSGSDDYIYFAIEA